MFGGFRISAIKTEAVRDFKESVNFFLVIRVSKVVRMLEFNL